MIKVKNNKTGQIEEIPEADIAGAVSSGIYSLPAGIKIPVISPDGTPGTISSEEAYTAFQSGFSYDTPEMREERRKEAEFGNRPASAAALGAARSLSFGLSDQALTKSGLIEAETLREIKERNPEFSTIGEVGGVVAPAFVTGGSSLLVRGATSGVRGAARAGTIAEKAVSRALSKRLAAQGNKTLAQKALTAVAPKAAGSAVEGAFYGAGHILSEDALGNADLNAETLMANVGLGSLIGGAAGGVFGAGALAGQGAKHLARKATEPAKPFMRRLLGASDDLEEGKLFTNFTQKKPNAADLQQRAKELDIQLTTGTLSASPVVRDAESILRETPTMWGEFVKKSHEDARRGFQRNAQALLKEATEKTEREVGEQIKDEIVSQLKGRYDPFKVAYGELKKSRPHIEIEPSSIQVTAKNLEKLGDEIGSRGGEVSRYTKTKAGLLSQQRTVDDLSNLISEIKSEARAFGRAGNERMAFAAREIGRRLDRLQERTILRTAVQLAREGAPGTQEAARQLIRDIRTTNTAYADFMRFVGDIAKEAKLGRGGYRQIVDKIEDLSPEQLVRKMFNTRDSKALNFFRENFPEQFEELRRLQISKIASKVTKEDGTYGPIVDIPAFMREYNKLSPELREILWDAGSRRTIENIDTLYRAFPGISNPSRTDIRADFSRLLTPILHLRDLALVGFLKSVEGADVSIAKSVEGLARVERSQRKAIQTIRKSITEFLKGAKETTRRAPAVSTDVLLNNSFQERKRKDDTDDRALRRISDKISRYATNQDFFIDQMLQSTSLLGAVAPKTTTSLQVKAFNAIQFLQSKLPSNPAAARSSNLSIREWKPSSLEIRKFKRYLEAVEDPFSVLRELADNRPTREGVETLKVVYPEIYNLIRDEVIDKVSELRVNLPYNKRLALSNLLDVPVDLAQEPDFIAGLQQFYKSQTPAEDKNLVPVSRAKNLKLSNQMQTETQRVANRT